MTLKQLCIRATCTYLSSAVYMVKLALSIDKLASLVQNEHFSLLKTRIGNTSWPKSNHLFKRNGKCTFRPTR